MPFLIRTSKVRELFSEISSIVNGELYQGKGCYNRYNGKTSICDYVRQHWENLNFKAASIGTLGLIFNKKRFGRIFINNSRHCYSKQTTKIYF